MRRLRAQRRRRGGFRRRCGQVVVAGDDEGEGDPRRPQHPEHASQGRRTRRASATPMINACGSGTWTSPARSGPSSRRACRSPTSPSAPTVRSWLPSCSYGPLTVLDAATGETKWTLPGPLPGRGVRGSERPGRRSRRHRRRARPVCRAIARRLQRGGSPRCPRRSASEDGTIVVGRWRRRPGDGARPHVGRRPSTPLPAHRGGVRRRPDP